jgi:hypothetical protein
VAAGDPVGDRHGRTERDNVVRKKIYIL